MIRDPINFLQLTVVEVHASKGPWTAAIISGSSVRFWEGVGQGSTAEGLLWNAQTRTEVVRQFGPIKIK